MTAAAGGRVAPPSPGTPARARLSPVAKSLLLHAAVLVALAAGLWWPRSAPPPPQSLAIEAVVVDQATLEPRRGPIQPRPEPVAPPEPEAERVDVERDRQLAQQREQQQRAERAQREVAQRAAAAKAAADRAAEEQRATEQRVAQQRAAERAAADKAAAEKAAADKRAAAEAALRAEREAELRRQLAAEENAQRARASGQGAAWAAAIQARIQRAWIRPDSARAGLDCTVIVNQVPGGEVTGVRIGACNGDDVVRQSIEAAVYRASPLPAPPDPALFERTIEVRFRPNE